MAQGDPGCCAFIELNGLSVIANGFFIAVKLP